MTLRIHKTLAQDGLTFVEILLVVGLLSMFMVVLLTIFTATIDTQTQTQSYSATNVDARFIMARLDFDIARASAVTTPTSLGASTTSLGLTIAGTTYTYALSGSNLQLTDSTGTANLNSDGSTISGLTFQRIGNAGGKDSVRYSFTVTSVAKANSGVTTQTFTSTAERRF